MEDETVHASPEAQAGCSISPGALGPIEYPLEDINPDDIPF